MLAQKDTQDAEPDAAGLHDVGTVVRTLQMLRVPDGTMKLLVEGVCRVSVTRFRRRRDHLPGPLTFQVR